MRVLVACDWFLKYAAAQAAGLCAAGTETALLCRDHAYEFGGDTAEREAHLERARRAGVDVLTIQGRVSEPAGMLRLVGESRRVRAWSPDIVHAHENHDPKLLVATRGYPLVLTVHDPVPHPGQPSLPRVKRQFRDAWRRRADVLVVHGESLREELGAFVGSRQIAILPHGTAPLAAPLDAPATPCVLFFGRLQRYKGLAVLLEAMEAVWRERPDVRLRVLGDGPEAASLPNDPRIDAVIGYVPDHEVEAAFRKASLVVLPYVQASQSGVGLLALARGIPLVVTRVGSLPELAVDSSFVVPPNDPAALARALVRHMDDDAAVRRATLHRAEQEFSWRGVGERSIDVYERLLTARAAAR